MTQEKPVVIEAVVHSYWDYEDENDTVAHCHHCGNASDWETNYCPSCGCKMDIFAKTYERVESGDKI